MYKVISFGHRCSSASFLQLLNLKTESYPFDWLVSKLDVIQDCIETNFVHFLNINNYSMKYTETYNMIDNTKQYLLNEYPSINMHYENTNDDTSTYLYKLALTHGNIMDKYEYYKRCIERLYELLNSDIKKYYLYIHPVMGTTDFQNNKENVLNEFEKFNQYITTKTENIFGIYFILIKHNENVYSVKLKETHNYNVFILYCNDQFLDGGGTFMGNYIKEEEEMLSVLKTVFV